MLDRIVETSRYDRIVEKFNPYHDARGRFSTADAATSFTYKPGQGKMYDNAIAREKERRAGIVSKTEQNISAMLKESAAVRLEGIDPAMAKPMEDNIRKVLERYPGVKDAFEGFTTEDLNGYFEKNDGAIACYDPRSQKIHLNTAYYGNRAKMDEAYKKSVEHQHSPAGTTLDSAVVHEMGHAIDRYVSKQIINEQDFMWKGDRISRRMWNNDIKNGQKSGTPVTGKSIREGLSSYASGSPSEYFAEGFAEYMTSPNPRPMATKIGKRLETYIRKAEKAGDQE